MFESPGHDGQGPRPPSPVARKPSLSANVSTANVSAVSASPSARGFHINSRDTTTIANATLRRDLNDTDPDMIRLFSRVNAYAEASAPRQRARPQSEQRKRNDSSGMSVREKLLADKSKVRERAVAQRDRRIELEQTFRKEVRRMRSSGDAPPQPICPVRLSSAGRPALSPTRRQRAHGADDASLSPPTPDAPAVEPAVPAGSVRAQLAMHAFDGDHLLRQSTVDAYFDVPAFLKPLVASSAGHDKPARDASSLQTVKAHDRSTGLNAATPYASAPAAEAYRRRATDDAHDVVFQRAQKHYA